MTIYFLSYHKLPNLPPKEINAVQALRDLHYKVEIVFWDAFDLNLIQKGDLVFLRSTWNYDQKPQEFRQFLIELKSKNCTVFNEVDLMLWNMDKSYMFEFQSKGLKVIPTYRVTEKEALLSDWPETQTIIAKPLFSAGARGLIKMNREEWIKNELTLTYICQPFVPSVPTEGEWSLIYFNGEYSHAVLKKAKQGDFRVQSDHGGTVTYVDLNSEWISLGKSYLESCSTLPFFARIDLVLWENQPVLIELEIIEPELFVTDTVANQNFVNSIVKKVQN